jgi:hypothetical protein
MNLGKLIFFIIITIGLILNFIIYFSQLILRKRKKVVLFKISLHTFVLYNVCYVFIILFGLIKIL